MPEPDRTDLRQAPPIRLLELVAPLDPSARPGQEGDALDGVLPSVVVTPGSPRALTAVLRQTAPSFAAVGVRGGGTKLLLGAPPERLDVLVSTARLDSVLEYEPGDMVIRVGAGTPLEQLQAVVGGAGQRLALDPPEAGATAGGVVATNSTGPRRLRFGAPRDLLIGVAAVLADGRLVHSGGKVVKNVAGYDLGKLLAGSLGTLAVLAELTFRLHPLPAAQRVVTRGGVTPGEAARLVARHLRSNLVPSALELDATLSAVTARTTLVALFEGFEPSVARQATDCAAILDGADVGIEPPEWFARRPYGAGDIGIKIAHPIAALPVVLAALEETARAHGFSARVRSSAGVGITTAGWPASAGPTDAAAVLHDLRNRVASAGATVVVVHAAPEAKEGLDVWGPVPGLELMRRVKAEFDPSRRLAPGRFAGGI